MMPFGPENHLLEYKSVLPAADKLARTMVAFANSRGGRLVIGYDESNDQLLGVNIDHKVEEHIANVAHGMCTPSVDYTIEYHSIENRILSIVSVSEGLRKPYYLKQQGVESGTFIRVGSTIRLADRETLQRLIRLSQNLPYDLEPIADRGVLSERLIAEFIRRRADKLSAPVVSASEELLVDLGLLRDGRATVAGVLLCAEQPQAVPALINAEIRLICFNNLDVVIDHKNAFGPLGEQIEAAVTFVLRHVSRSGAVVGLKRSDTMPITVDVVRELITNAIVHRDYSMSGSAITLKLHERTLTIVSPGGLAGPVTVENLAVRQFSRNPIISKRMFEMGYFDSWGQGIDRVLAWARKANYRQPVFTDEVDQFTASVSWEAILENLGDRERRLLALIKRAERISSGELRKISKMSKTQVYKAIESLLSQQLIERFGHGRATYYFSRD